MALEEASNNELNIFDMSMPEEETVAIVSLWPELVPKTKFIFPKDALLDAIFFRDNLASSNSIEQIEIPASFQICDAILKILLNFLLFRFRNPELKIQMDALALDKRIGNNFDMAEEDRVLVQAMDSPNLTLLVRAAHEVKLPSLRNIIVKEMARRITNVPFKEFHYFLTHEPRTEY